ncbi:hypothetical protein [Xenococcus sp. PCC 7305]|uniref:hypothetical protein n=1 Tax=Xenococcus sp. PCC 7305 TaxID=102125 RepID=UPI00059270D8|nr:hypothetical protein [Xenococcus sp. PCC 7305]
MLAFVLFVLCFSFLSCLFSSRVPAPVPPAPWWVGASCSLAVRSAVVPSSCCLLRSRSGRPLSGAARSSRVGRLRRSGVWF